MSTLNTTQSKSKLHTNVCTPREETIILYSNIVSHCLIFPKSSIHKMLHCHNLHESLKMNQSLQHFFQIFQDYISNVQNSIVNMNDVLN